MSIKGFQNQPIQAFDLDGNFVVSNELSYDADIEVIESSDGIAGYADSTDTYVDEKIGKVISFEEAGRLFSKRMRVPLGSRMNYPAAFELLKTVFRALRHDPNPISDSLYDLSILYALKLFDKEGDGWFRGLNQELFGVVQDHVETTFKKTGGKGIRSEDQIIFIRFDVNLEKYIEGYDACTQDWHDKKEEIETYFKNAVLQLLNESLADPLGRVQIKPEKEGVGQSGQGTLLTITDKDMFQLFPENTTQNFFDYGNWLITPNLDWQAIRKELGDDAILSAKDKKEFVERFDKVVQEFRVIQGLMNASGSFWDRRKAAQLHEAFWKKYPAILRGTRSRPFREFQAYIQQGLTSASPDTEKHFTGNHTLDDHSFVFTHGFDLLVPHYAIRPAVYRDDLTPLVLMVANTSLHELGHTFGLPHDQSQEINVMDLPSAPSIHFNGSPNCYDPMLTLFTFSEYDWMYLKMLFPRY